MKILITGGAGFIGSHVADAYLEAGHDVVVVDDLSSGALANLDPRVKFYQLDVCSPALDDVFHEEQPELVNHHAAQVSVPRSISEPLQDIEVNLKGLLNILQCCIKYKVRKVIFISSGGAIYGDAHEYPTSELCPPEPLSVYAVNKWAGEEFLRLYHRLYGLDFTILRYANVYGPRQDPRGEAGVVSIFMDKLLRGEAPQINAYPDEEDGMIRDYVYVLDVVRANLAALTKGGNDVFNIGTGVETTTKLLYKTILWQLGKDIQPEMGPPRDGDLRRSMLKIGKAFKELGWSPIYTLEDGIRETIEISHKENK